jgi:polo-like kinase 1
MQPVKTVELDLNPLPAPALTNQPDLNNKLIKEVIRSPSGAEVVKNYVIGKFLGKGGFAKVYEIRSLEDSGLQAVKVVHKSQLEKPRAKHKLITEIKLHRAMKHENIARFINFFEDEDHVYIVLELCSNQTLSDLVKRRKRLTELEVQCYCV